MMSLEAMIRPRERAQSSPSQQELTSVIRVMRELRAYLELKCKLQPDERRCRGLTKIIRNRTLIR